MRKTCTYCNKTNITSFLPAEIFISWSNAVKGVLTKWDCNYFPHLYSILLVKIV